VSRHLNVVDILYIPICHLFLFAVLTSEIKLFDKVVVEGSIRPVDYKIMAVDSVTAGGAGGQQEGLQYNGEAAW
jgi:hypothetical protein